MANQNHQLILFKPPSIHRSDYKSKRSIVSRPMLHNRMLYSIDFSRRNGGENLNFREDGTFRQKRNAAAQRRVLMASLIIPVSLLIISAGENGTHYVSGQRAYILHRPPCHAVCLPISLSRQLQYLLATPRASCMKRRHLNRRRPNYRDNSANRAEKKEERTTSMLRTLRSFLD